MNKMLPRLSAVQKKNREVEEEEAEQKNTSSQNEISKKLRKESIRIANSLRFDLELQ